MPPKRGGKQKKKATKRQEIDEEDDNLQEDDDLLNMGAEVPGMDQEDITQEEKEEMIFKVLTSNNPNASHNLTKFSYKERVFKTEETVD